MPVHVDIPEMSTWWRYSGACEQSEGGSVTPFYEQPLDQRWRGMFEAGVRAHFVVSWCATPLLLERGSGLILSTAT